VQLRKLAAEMIARGDGPNAKCGEIAERMFSLRWCGVQFISCRGIGLKSAIALNMKQHDWGRALHYPATGRGGDGRAQAIIGWVLGAILAASDGLVWAELGAAMPYAGGSYQFLQHIYGPGKWGKYLSFSLHLATCVQCSAVDRIRLVVGMAQYAGYLFPALRHVIFAKEFAWSLPIVGNFESPFPSVA